MQNNRYTQGGIRVCSMPNGCHSQLMLSAGSVEK